MAQLDRILVNLHFLNYFGDVTVSYLSRTSSDHALMLVQFIRDRVSVIRPFKFLHMWGSHEGFLPLVQAVWNDRVEGCAMVRISTKLKLLKHAL